MRKRPLKQADPVPFPAPAPDLVAEPPVDEDAYEVRLGRVIRDVMLLPGEELPRAEEAVSFLLARGRRGRLLPFRRG